MSNSRDWQIAFSQVIQPRETAQALKEAALNERLGDWTASAGHNLKLSLHVEVSQSAVISAQKIEETKGALRKL